MSTAATSSVIGDCRLCGAKNVSLQDSHILPKWTYRRARDASSSNGAQHPIMYRENVVLQTSQQVREHLLCFACEQLLSRDESYVSTLAFQPNGTLGLLGLLHQGSIFRTEHQLFGASPRAAHIASLDCQSISRFAASVFWRAHVARDSRNLSGLHLWNPQAECLRQFVLGERPLPERMCLMFLVLVNDVNATDVESVHSTTTATPTSAKKGDDGFHQFIAAGLLFNLTTGRHSLPPICVACSSSPCVVFQNWKMVRYARNLSDQMVTSPRKGRLASP